MQSIFLQILMNVVSAKLIVRNIRIVPTTREILHVPATEVTLCKNTSAFVSAVWFTLGHFNRERILKHFFDKESSFLKNAIRPN